MSAAISVSAPGKLVLAGEYAVLLGAPAISAAVDRQARAVLQPAAYSEMHIVNTGRRYAFDLLGNGELDWRVDPGAAGDALQATLAVLAERHALPLVAEPLALELCTRSFYTEGADGSVQKIGIGSSAAIVVALCTALQEYFGLPEAFADCLAAHRRMQEGGGSGIDVATSWYGGVVALQPESGAVPMVEELAWPAGLYVLPVWTGRQASTPAMLRSFNAFRGGSDESAGPIMAGLRRRAEAALGAWRSGDSKAIETALHEYGVGLSELDRAARIGIWSKEHALFSELAGRLGLSYKPSGAGGGDFGLVIASDPARIEAFSAELGRTTQLPQPAMDWSANGRTVHTG